MARRQTDIEALYRAHAAALIRFLTGLLRSTEDAEEVAQEALLRLWRLPDRPVPARPRSLLFTTAYRIAIDRLRRRRLERVLFAAGDAGAAATADEPSGERAVIGRQSLCAVALALDAMKPIRRDILVMNRIDGLSYGEIARRTGLTPDSIQKHVARAVVACGATLARDGRRAA